jgi:hypothetical protein
MPGVQESILALWYRALHSPLGIELVCSDVEVIRGRLYAARKESRDTDLNKVAICQSPTQDSGLSKGSRQWQGDRAIVSTPSPYAGDHASFKSFSRVGAARSSGHRSRTHPLHRENAAQRLPQEDHPTRSPENMHGAPFRTSVHHNPSQQMQTSGPLFRCKKLQYLVLEGPDKTYIMRKPARSRCG